MQPDKYSDLSTDDLLKRVYYTDMKNRQLKSRIEQLQPYKQRQINNPPAVKHSQLFAKFALAKFALKIMYIGTNYNGVEYQENNTNTVQWFLFKCLYGLSLIENKVPDKEEYTRAARTDKGVSAYGNVIAIKLRTNILKQSQGKQEEKKEGLNYVKMINSILPEDIRVIACKQVLDSFNARYSCYQRSYKYFFPKNYYNIELMTQAIKKFIGTHNFVNFCKLDITNTIDFQKVMHHASVQKCQQTSHIYNHLQADERNQIYYFHFVANSFLWHQIRYMATILFLVGMGRQKPEIVDEMLDIQRTPNKPNYPAAPEFPLILDDCKFKDLEFEIGKEEGVGICNTLNGVIMTRVMEMTLYVNCLEVMKGWGLKSIGLSEEELVREAIEGGRKKEIARERRIQFSKATGIAYQEKQGMLKGKEKELFEKKAEKRKKYHEKKQETNQQ